MPEYEHCFFITRDGPYYDLGDNVFAYPSMHSGCLKVHIKQFENEEATDKGVELSPHAWYQFTQKYVSLQADFIDTSFITNNELIVTVEEEGFHFQELFRYSCGTYILKNRCIDLNFNQMARIEEHMERIDKHLIEMVLMELLPNTILQSVPTQNTCANICQAKDILLQCVENSVVSEMAKYYKCTGCRYQYANQLGHECLTMSHSDKFNRLGEKILYVINVKETALKFVETLNATDLYVNDDFFKQIYLDYYVAGLFINEDV